jgi:hypothetical protein
MAGREMFVPAAWLYERISGDSALAAAMGITLGDLASRVGRPTLPIGTPSPYILISEQSAGNDVQGIGGLVLMTSPLWLVRAVVHDSDDSSLIPVVDRLHTLLQRQPASGVRLTSLVGTSVACVRVQTHYRAENDDQGHPFREAGHVWRLFVEDH